MTHPVYWWPARLPPAVDGVFVIGVRGDGDRPAARLRIRTALREALGQLTGLAPEDIVVKSTPGSSPRVALGSGADEFRRVRSRAHAVPGIAISHDGPLSLAAINLKGQVGIDLMEVADIPDWHAVAREYLGRRVTAALETCATSDRAAAFARAWTEREARLKCLGLPLTEWNAAASHDEARCRSSGLDLPAGFVGTIAVV